MKTLLTRHLLPATLILASGNALAHTGHTANEAIHSFLHTEHIIMLVAVGLTAYIVKSLYK
jgi:hydrogenase/urease accessory protein HupE